MVSQPTKVRSSKADWNAANPYGGVNAALGAHPQLSRYLVNEGDASNLGNQALPVMLIISAILPVT